MERGAFILRGEIVQSNGVKPGHTTQLSLQLEDEYTHNMILDQKYREKVEIVLARHLEPPQVW